MAITIATNIFIAGIVTLLLETKMVWVFAQAGKGSTCHIMCHVIIGCLYDVAASLHRCCCCPPSVTLPLLRYSSGKFKIQYVCVQAVAFPSPTDSLHRMPSLTLVCLVLAVPHRAGRRAPEDTYQRKVDNDIEAPAATGAGAPDTKFEAREGKIQQALANLDRYNRMTSNDLEK